MRSEPQRATVHAQGTCVAKILQCKLEVECFTALM